MIRPEKGISSTTIVPWLWLIIGLVICAILLVQFWPDSDRLERLQFVQSQATPAPAVTLVAARDLASYQVISSEDMVPVVDGERNPNDFVYPTDAVFQSSLAAVADRILLVSYGHGTPVSVDGLGPVYDKEFLNCPIATLTLTPLIGQPQVGQVIRLKYQLPPESGFVATQSIEVYVLRVAPGSRPSVVDVLVAIRDTDALLAQTIEEKATVWISSEATGSLATVPQSC